MRSGDGGTIADLSVSHHKSLQLMRQHYRQLEEMVRAAESRKTSITLHIHKVCVFVHSESHTCSVQPSDTLGQIIIQTKRSSSFKIFITIEIGAVKVSFYRGIKYSECP